MLKTRVNPAEKIAAVKKYLNGEGSQKSITAEWNISQASFQQWIRNLEVSYPQYLLFVNRPLFFRY